MMKTFFAIFVSAILAVGALVAQDGSPVSISQGSPYIGYTYVPTFSGTSMTFLCQALSTQSVQTITVASATTANPAVFTVSAGHGFTWPSATTSTPSINITGATGNWAPINGIKIATPLSTTTFSIAVNSTAYGSFSGQPAVFTTRAPLVNKPYWAIQKLSYDGSSNMIWRGWAVDITGGLTGGTPSMRFRCDQQASLAYQ